MVASSPTLLEQLNTLIAVDADTLDAAFIASLPTKLHDMTSNPRFILEALLAPENKEVVEGVVKDMKGKAWDEVYPYLVSDRRPLGGVRRTSAALMDRSGNSLRRCSR